MGQQVEAFQAQVQPQFLQVAGLGGEGAAASVLRGLGPSGRALVGQDQGAVAVQPGEVAEVSDVGSGASGQADQRFALPCGPE